MIPSLLTIIITMIIVLFAPELDKSLSHATNDEIIYSMISVVLGVVVMKALTYYFGKILGNEYGSKKFYNIFVFSNIFPAFILAHGFVPEYRSLLQVYIVSYAASLMLCYFIVAFYFFFYVMSKKNATVSDYLLLGWLFRDKEY